jgi:hypothetical protein
MKDPPATHHSMKDPVLPYPRKLGPGPGTGPGHLQAGHDSPTRTTVTNEGRLLR